jgi:glycosyltransferase 2 family protein
MKTRLKKIWSVGWRLGFCLLLLLWVFHSIFMSQGKTAAQNSGLDWSRMDRWQQWNMAWSKGPQVLWQTLRLIHPAALGVSVLLAGLALLIGVVRWRMVLEVQGLHLPLGRAARISFVAQFFNAFLLGSTGGDLIKAYYAARETHHKKTEAVTTVLVDRAVGLWAMLLFAGLMMIPNYDMVRASGDVAVPALIILASLGGVSAVLAVAFWGGVSKGIPTARMYLRRLPKGELLERAVDSCRQFGQQKSFLLKTIALSLLVNVICVAQIIVVGRGLDLTIPPLALFVIVPMILCFSSLPIAPGGLGVRETLYVAMLAVINVPKTAALSVSLIASAQGVFWSLVGGLIYMGVRQKDHLSEVTQGGGDAKEN